jgi:hypothetical protein
MEYILHTVKADIPSDHISNWEYGLPKEWAALIENACI